jgi:hypothetical protein
MKYKQLETLDYTSEDNCMGEIIFNGQTSGSFRKANSKEGWVDTWIIYGLTKQHFPDFLKDENGKCIVVRLYGKVEIFALDKQGKRIEEKEE